jgi:hypothetical protein
LGSGANITEYIQLGNAYIYNPNREDGSNRSFISIKNNDNNIFNLTDDGNMTIGNITINGNTSSMAGEKWSINPEKASFN